MKNIIVLLVATLVMAGCVSKERSNLEEKLTERFKTDKDLADYNITPEDMAECVADDIASNAPGFPGSPKKRKHLEAYGKLILVNPTDNYKSVLEETEQVFGSTQKAYKAASGITEQAMTCMSKLMKNPGRRG